MRYIPASQPPAQPLKRNPQRNDNLIVRNSDQRLVVGVDLGTCDAKVAYAICDKKDNKLLELISRIETLDFEGAPALPVKVAYSPIKIETKQNWHLDQQLLMVSLPWWFQAATTPAWPSPVTIDSFLTPLCRHSSRLDRSQKCHLLPKAWSRRRNYQYFSRSAWCSWNFA